MGCGEGFFYFVEYYGDGRCNVFSYWGFFCYYKCFGFFYIKEEYFVFFLNLVVFDEFVFS